MSQNRAEDFARRVRNNGAKLKNVPNTQTNATEFSFSDYVSKNPYSWGMVPAEEMSDEEAQAYAQDVAEEMYDCYEPLNQFSEISVSRDEDGRFWATVVVDVPEDNSRRERLAEEVAESILSRQQI